MTIFLGKKGYSIGKMNPLFIFCFGVFVSLFISQPALADVGDSIQVKRGPAEYVSQESTLKEVQQLIGDKFEKIKDVVAPLAPEYKISEPLLHYYLLSKPASDSSSFKKREKSWDFHPLAMNARISLEGDKARTSYKLKIDKIIQAGSVIVYGPPPGAPGVFLGLDFEKSGTVKLLSEVITPFEELIGVAKKQFTPPVPAKDEANNKEDIFLDGIVKLLFLKLPFIPHLPTEPPSELYGMKGRSYAILMDQFGFDSAPGSGGEGVYLYDIELKAIVLSYVKLFGLSSVSPLKKPSKMYLRDLVFVLTAVGENDYGLVSSLPTTSELEFYTFITDFLNDWKMRFYNQIDKYFGGVPKGCSSREQMINFLDTILDRGVDFYPMGGLKEPAVYSIHGGYATGDFDPKEKLRTGEAHGWLVQPAIQGNGNEPGKPKKNKAGLSMIVAEKSGMPEIQVISVEGSKEGETKPYKMCSTICGLVPPAPKMVCSDKPQVYKPRRCPKGKNCYQLAATAGKITTINWNGQHSIIEDRNHRHRMQVSFRGSDDVPFAGILLDFTLSDGVVVTCQANKCGECEIEGTPVGKAEIKSTDGWIFEPPGGSSD